VVVVVADTAAAAVVTVAVVLIRDGNLLSETIKKEALIKASFFI
jgi:hypothetical protein